MYISCRISTIRNMKLDNNVSVSRALQHNKQREKNRIQLFEVKELQVLGGSDIRVSKLWLTDQTQFTLICVNTISLEHNRTHLFTYCLWLRSCYDNKVE